ncbi:MAG: L-histidine N(alpha)-methyltransferase, partial [Cyclobacteriaceae bacterium]|nr:L-histidine N(alpha)-methyltransferase [Cyclobacteriaceae bacterium SS2]
NRELGGDFELSCFRHYPTYNPITGECTSHLISLVDQEVFLKELNLKVHFEKWEPIKTEISRKFNLDDIRSLAEIAGFSVTETLFDEEKLFAESIWEVK